MIKNVKLVELNTQTLEMIKQNANVCVVTKIQQKFDEKVNEQIFNACKFSNYGNNKYILLLEKVFIMRTRKQSVNIFK